MLSSNRHQIAGSIDENALISLRMLRYYNKPLLSYSASHYYGFVFSRQIASSAKIFLAPRNMKDSCDLFVYIFNIAQITNFIQKDYVTRMRKDVIYSHLEILYIYS